MSSGELPLGFLERFLAAVESWPEAIALERWGGGERLTYRELAELAAVTQGRFAELGVGPGRRVVILLPNGAHFVASYLALVSLGAIPVLVHASQTSGELRALLDRARPFAVVTETGLAARHRSCLEALERTLVICCDGPTEHVQLARVSAVAMPLRAPAGDPPAALFFTYKGLGRPLGVVHRYRALMLSADGVHRRLAVQGPGSAHLVALPMHAVFGLTCSLLLPLSVGARILLVDQPTTHDLREVLRREQVSLFCVVPDLLRHMLSASRGRPRAGAGELHPELILLSGGSYLDPDLADEVGAVFGLPPPMQGYGTTECLPVMVESHAGPRRRGSIGQAIHGVELFVRTAEGDLRCTGVGELVVAGPTLTEGFLDDPEATDAFFRGGRFCTGDLVRIDDEGYVSFLGRRARFTKIAASMVDLAEVEAVACSIDGVSAARVAVRRDPLGRNGLLLEYSGNDVDRATLLGALKERLSPYKVPRALRAREEVRR